MDNRKRKKRDRRAKRIAKENRRKTKRHSGPGPVFVPSPFNDLPREALLPAVLAAATKSQSELSVRLDSILRILRSVEPLQALSMLVVYGLCGSMDAKGERRSFLPKGSKFSQPDAEFAQALVLTIPQCELAVDPPSNQSIQELFESLPAVSQAFGMQRMLVMGKERSKEEKSIGMLQEALRAHTQHVRNWGFFDDVVRTLKALYSPLDERFATHVGMSATQIVDGFVSLLRGPERAMNRQKQILSEVFAERTVSGMIRKYYELNPDFPDAPEDMLRVVEMRKLNVEETKFLLVSHMEYRLPSLFEFSAGTLAASVGASESNAQQLLDRLSLSPGELAGHELQRLFLSNPVWQKPIVNLGRGRYFCAMPQVFFSFALQIMGELSRADPDLERACFDRRADYLENSIFDLFRRAFPSATLTRNFRWKEGDQQFENDLIVKIDSHLMLIEAKSGSISWPALRGAAERARKHIEELILAPSIQSDRLAQRIRLAIRSSSQASEAFPGLDLQGVRTVLRLSVTLEDFATIQSNLHHLEDTGWLPSEHTTAPCILLGDLETVFKILEPEGQKLNYLRRRTELASRLTTVGDELDHLGLYLANGFNMAQAEADHVNLVISGMSDEIDSYCMARSAGIHTAKPKPRLGKWWSAICDTVQHRKFPRWTDTYYVLLSVSPDEQEKAEQMFVRVKSNIAAFHGSSAQKDSVVIIPPEQRSNAIVLFAFRDAESGKRHARMRSMAGQTFANPHVQRCLALAINVDRERGSYSTLGMFFRDDPKEGNVDELVVY